MNNLSLSLYKLVKRSPITSALLFFALLFSQASVAQTAKYATVGQSHLNCPFDPRGKTSPANDLQGLDLSAALKEAEMGELLNLEPINQLRTFRTIQRGQTV